MLSALFRFGYIACRAHTLHASRLPASDALDRFRLVLPLQNLSLRTDLAERSRGALTHAGFGFRQARLGFTLAGFLPA